NFTAIRDPFTIHVCGIGTPAGRFWRVRTARAGPIAFAAPASDNASMSPERYEMGEEERRLRQSFLGLTQADAKNVQALRNAFAAHSREFAERFYEHLLANPHTAAFLRDPQQLEQLKRIQAGYFATLLEGQFDAAYFEGRLRVGLAHQRIGLEPD